MVLRFLRFNVVSALGIGVRLASVAVLASGLGLHYLVATVIAIEVSVLHNFFWHQRWTWGGQDGRREARAPVGRRQVFFQCVAFHASNGLVSILGAMVLMPVLVGALGVNYLLANVVAICVTGVLNFLLGDRLIFRPTAGQASVS